MKTFSNSTKRENTFCHKCGANFPPRMGEGICKNWKKECLIPQVIKSHAVDEAGMPL